MKKLQSLMIVAVLLLMVGVAQAGPLPPPLNNDLQNFLDIGTGTPGAVKVSENLEPKSPWTWTATGGSYNIVLQKVEGISSFGIYDPSNISNKLEIFSGYQLNAGITKATLEYEFDGGHLATACVTGSSFCNNTYLTNKEFGYYVVSSGNTFIDVTSMLSFQGGAAGLQWNGARWSDGEYILAWEAGGIRDYMDFVVMVESVTPLDPGVIPEPSSILLLGGGLIGLCFASYRGFKK